jgi:hypothetical protein
MKFRGSLIAIAALWTAAACAATLPSALMPGTVIGGDKAQTIAHHDYECQIFGPLPSSFMRSASGPATITFMGSGIAYTDKYSIGSNPAMLSDYYSGAAVFSFTVPSSGLLKFDAPPSTSLPATDPAHQNITFSNYKQSYDAVAKVLTVNFELEFPSCKVSTQAIFHAG